MTRQIPDTLKIKNKKYKIAAASDFNALLDVKKFGLIPGMMHTACWKGFYVDFKIKDGVLKLDNLTIADENRKYPDINGVVAKSVFNHGLLKEKADYIKEYKNIDLNINYTGYIYIADELCFNGRIDWTHSLSLDECECVKELYFENGKMIEMREFTNEVERRA